MSRAGRAPKVTIRSSAEQIAPEAAVVVIDVIRATTTAITALARGHRCLIAGDLAHLNEVVSLVERPLLVGEIDGVMPEGFDL
ncbi:MAG: 2-phosphosulfolactate phosphatase, partial [Actinomycetota bacterium]